MLKLYEKLNCTFTAEEKEECFHLVRRLVDINDETIRNGFHPIDDDIHNMDEEKNFFLKTALISAVDLSLVYVDSQSERATLEGQARVVEDLLSSLIIADRSTGAELLGRLMIMQGVVSIVKCERSDLLCYRLLCMLGQEYLTNKNIDAILGAEYLGKFPKKENIADFLK